MIVYTYEINTNYYYNIFILHNNEDKVITLIMKNEMDYHAMYAAKSTHEHIIFVIWLLA